MLNIVQHGDQFELRIDNQSFSHLYNMEKTRNAFKYEGQEEEVVAEKKGDRYDEYSPKRDDEQAKPPSKIVSNTFDFD